MVEYDTLIKGGLIVDGSGKAAFKGSVAVTGDRIASLGKLENVKANQIIDANGDVVSPGFIDAHGHADHTILLYPLAESYVEQGVTTCIGGNCGFAPAPLGITGLVCSGIWMRSMSCVHSSTTRPT